MKTFELINPYIEGNFKRIFKDETSIKAADNCYKKISGYIRNPVNEFYYTLRDIKTNKYHNFVVTEKTNKKNKTVNYSIEELKNKINKTELKNFENNLSSIQNNLSGGKKKYSESDDSDLDDSDDSSSSSESEKYTKFKYIHPYIPYSPITHYWYYPYIYPVSKIFIPHFSLPLTPIVEIGLSTSFYKN